DETPESFAAQVEHFARDLGANIVGGCCGTSPEHLQHVIDRVGNLSPKQRDAKLDPSASSIYFQQPYMQDASFLIVGERVNASGSKKMRDLLDAEDWDGLVNLAKSQEKEGAHILDVNVDFVGRDGVADMHELVSRLVTSVKIPIMLDSTEWEKMEAGLEHAGGKCILNSTNYEDGEPRFLKVLDLAKEYGAGVVIGLIDEDGMARKAEDKLRIARRAYKHATEGARTLLSATVDSSSTVPTSSTEVPPEEPAVRTGVSALRQHDIFFDPLALPISTGIEEDRKNALETINAIKQIKAEMPEANIILGVSNISFGLSPAARVVLNSVFLHDCVEAGMNSAIVNASKILPLIRFNEHEIEVARDLIYDRRKWNADTLNRSSDTPVRMDAASASKGDADHDLISTAVEAAEQRSEDAPVRMSAEHEQSFGGGTADGDKSVPAPVCTYDPLIEFTTLFEGKTAQSIKPDITNLPVEERLKHHIIDGEKIGLEDSLKQALEKYPPLDIINNILLDGMKTVGDLFGSGQMQLPFVLQSAEAMKTAVKFLEPFMDRVEGSNKGTMVIATVKGDVHDIGKNLVDIILTNNGYRVVNLGIKQPIDEILRNWEESKADAIGMSGLLVKSTLVMRDNLELMNERGISVPVILGGAALNRRYVDKDLIPLYNGKLFYARDAFDGLHVMDQLTNAEPRTSVRAIQASAGNGAEPQSARLESGIEVPDASVTPALESEDLVGEDAKLGAVAARISARSAGDTTHTERSAVSANVSIPKAPFYGSKVVEITDLTKVFEFINETALFKGQWQYKQGRKTPEEYKQILEETVYPRFAEIKAQAIREKLLEAKLVYGYFPCRSSGNDLIIYEDDEKTERMRFTFPRQPVEQRGGKNLCLADYFALIGSGKIDVVAFDLVTMGRKASEHSAKLFKSDNYTDYLLFHGLSVESAEALAEMWHKRIREELGIAGGDAPELTKLFHQGYQGSRYSFGYPACPNVEDQTKLFELLQPERIDVTLTDEFMLDPEQSTSAIIVYHPEAKYFNVE
ncbi:MAG: vitamin B12 dependent-methionine synthase activation domain-containing protein, partial [Pyrinomonadaceae bacterium]